MAGLILSCTPPPSANRLWQRTRNGMTKSREYRAWLSEAGWQLKTQCKKPLEGPIHITLRVPENGRRDLDNHVKPTLDLLTSLGMIDGDRFKTVKRITMEWRDKPAMLIQIEPWQSGQSTLRRLERLLSGKLGNADSNSTPS